MELIYVDTCIFISFITNEMNLSGKLKGDYLYFIFEKFFNKEHKLVVSKWTLYEIKKILRVKNMRDDFCYIQGLIDDLKKIDNVVIIRWDENDEIEAKKLDEENFDDAMHVILAKKSNSKILVTENMKDFEKYKDLIEIFHPRDLVHSDFF